jgi:hypothetical protein
MEELSCRLWPCRRRQKSLIFLQPSNEIAMYTANAFQA